MHNITSKNNDTHTNISNKLLGDSSLSFKARGLLAYMLSTKGNLTADSLAKESKDGRTAVLSALKELENAGYRSNTKQQDELGQWIWVTNIFDSPQNDK